MNIRNAVLSLMAIVGMLAAFFGVHEWQESRYTLNIVHAQTEKKVEEIKKTVDYHIINQQREVLEYRVEKKAAEYKKEPTKDKKELLEDLKKRLAEKEKELKKLEEKK